MSLDLTFEALSHFAAQLEAFDTALRSSQRAMQERHHAIDGLWRDEARRTYDRSFADLDAQLNAYLGAESERYETFVRQKLRQLASYLHGG